MDDKGKEYSKKPLPRKRAVAQMRALYANDLEGAGLLGDIFGKIKTTAQRYFTPQPTRVVKQPQTDEGLPPASVLQQMVKVAYDGGTVNGWTILKRTPTLTFFQRGRTVVIAVRGTYDKRDLRADIAIPLDNLENTDRFKEDLATVQQFVQQNPSYSYYATGHSLGGAIIDKLLQLSLVKDAISFNPAIEPSDYQKGDRHRRIYFESDPLYKLMGKNAVGTEVRPSKYSLLRSIPGIGQLLDTALSHSIDNFVGGNIEDIMIRMPKSDYYAEHKRIIDLLNKTSASLKKEADIQSGEVRKKRSGGSASLRYGGRSLRGFVVDCESDSDYDDEDIESIEGGAEPMGVPFAGVPFDMVRVMGPALPTFGNDRLNGGRVETPEERRQREAREAADRRRNEPAQPARARTPPRQPAQQPAQPPPRPLRERVQPPPRLQIPDNLNRRLDLQGGGDDEEMEELVELMKEKMATPVMERPKTTPKKRITPPPLKKAVKRKLSSVKELDESEEKEGGAKMTLPLLKAKAKAMGLKGFSKMKKGELMTALSGGGPMSSGVRRINRGMKGQMAPLAAKVAENIISNRGNPLGLVADLTTTAMGGAKDPKSLAAELLEKMKSGKSFTLADLMKDSCEKFGREFVPPPKPVGMKRQREGRGRLQRRSPKTLRLSAKDKSKC